jgi:hypothetical protein
VSKEATPSNDEEAPFDDAARRAQNGIRTGNKWCKQRPLGTATTASRDEDRGWEAGSSGMGGTSATTRSGRRSARMPTDHFNRLLEEACPNHAYPVRHKLKDCGMMWSFMTSLSLTWGTEPDEGPDGSDVAPFPEENVIMMVFGGRPLAGRRHMSSLGARIPTHGGWGRGGQGCNDTSSPLHSSKNINIYIYVYVYILACVFYSSP